MQFESKAGARQIELVSGRSTSVVVALHRHYSAKNDAGPIKYYIHTCCNVNGTRIVTCRVWIYSHCLTSLKAATSAGFAAFPNRVNALSSGSPSDGLIARTRGSTEKYAPVFKEWARLTYGGAHIVLYANGTCCCFQQLVSINALFAIVWSKTKLREPRGMLFLGAVGTEISSVCAAVL